MGDEGRGDGTESTKVEVVPSANSADTPEPPPVVREPTSAEPPRGDSDAGNGTGFALSEVAVTTQRPETSSDGIEEPSSREDEAPDLTYDEPTKRGPIRSWFYRQRDGLIRDALIGVVIVLLGFAAAAVWDARIADRQDRLARELADNQDRLARELASNSEVQENTRFVRQVVIDNGIQKSFRGLNLRAAALGGLDLGCADRTTTTAADSSPTLAAPPSGCADLRDADLTAANLGGADLFGADLGGADLSGADLMFAQLSRASLRGANLTNANLIAASLDDAYLLDTNLTGANLNSAYLVGANMTRALLNGADLAPVTLTGADLTQTDLTDADLEGSDLTAANLRFTNLTRTSLTRVCYDETTTWPDGFTPPEQPSC